MAAMPGPRQFPTRRIPTRSLPRSQGKIDIRIATTNHLETLQFSPCFRKLPGLSEQYHDQQCGVKIQRVSEALEKGRIGRKKMDRSTR
jgi:hypothetical protein